MVEKILNSDKPSYNNNHSESNHFTFISNKKNSNTKQIILISLISLSILMISLGFLIFQEKQKRLSTSRITTLENTNSISQNDKQLKDNKIESEKLENDSLKKDLNSVNLQDPLPKSKPDEYEVHNIKTTNIYYLTELNYEKLMNNLKPEKINDPVYNGILFENELISKPIIWNFQNVGQSDLDGFLYKENKICRIEQIWCAYNPHFENEEIASCKEYIKSGSYSIIDNEVLDVSNNSEACCLNLVSHVSYSFYCAQDPLNQTDNYEENVETTLNAFKESGIDCSNCLKQTKKAADFSYYKDTYRNR